MRQRRCQRRYGATVVEMAIVAPVALVFLIGIVDIGVAVWSYNVAAEAAREGTRYAVVHGSLSAQPVGPSSNNAAVESTVRKYAFGMSSTQIQVTSSWPNGTNTPGSLVTVQVDYSYKPALLFQLGTVKFRSSTTMTVCH